MPAAPRPSRRFGLAVTAGVVAAVLVVGAAAYALGGYLVASNRISDAAGAISAVDSHRASINSALGKLASLTASVDPMSTTATTGKSSAGGIVTQSQTLASLVAGNVQALRIAQLKLNDVSWLTAFSRASLQDESGRIDHARKAVTDVKSAADDYALLGAFLQSYWQVFVDLDGMIAANQANDATAYVNAYTSFRSDIATSLDLITVPGLPTAYHDELTDLQAVSNDIRQQASASVSGDNAAYAAATKALNADAAKADAVDFSGAGAAIHSYYQHYLNDFNSELDQALS